MRRRISTGLLSVTLLIFIAAGLLAFTAAAINQPDYAYPHATKTEEIYPDGLLESLLGLSVSDTEREYLRLYGGYKLTYNYGIPTTYVTTEYDRESGALTVFAKEYGYVAENGVTVIWKPVSAALYSENKPLTAPEYSASFYVPSAASGDAVTVKYKADFVIEKDTLNRLLNLAYSDAVKYKATIEQKAEEYEEACRQYSIDTEKYNEYVSALALYREYLIEKRIHDEQLAEYNAYLSELVEYEAQKVRYDEYVIAREKYYEEYAKYKEYLAYASKYESKVEAYKKYLKEMETVRAQLAIIESTKTPVTTLKRTVYGAITGDTVTSVIANKDAIANSVTGADPATIDRAGVATENLRALFDGFFSAKGEAARYNYYITNYEGFRDNFAELLRTLDKLYMNRKVRGALIAEDKKEKYVILLAQLYYVTNALSDDPVGNYDGDGYFDSSYLIGRSTDYYPDAASPADILNNDIPIADTNNAAPLAAGYPSAVEVPDIFIMEEPKMPVPVSSPILPETVSRPTVKEPAPVAEPSPVAKPGSTPAPYTLPEGVSPIITSYEKGELSQRTSITSDLIYSPEITVRKAFFNPETVTVKYYGKKGLNDEEELLYEIEIDAGTYADYVGAVPVKMEDRTHTYSHTGWVDAVGNTPDLSCVTENLILYADFTAIEKDYKTSWMVDGIEYDVCPEEPSVSPSGNIYYAFKGWEKTYGVDPVTKEPILDVIWEARFEEREYVITDSKYVTLDFDGTDYVVDARADSKMDIGALIDAAAGEGGIVINASNATVRFSYTETLALKAAGVRSISTHSALQYSDGSYAYSVTLYGSGGVVSDHKARLTFESYCTADNPTHLYLYSGEGEEKKTVKSTFIEEKKRIKFTMTSGVKYVAREEYSLKPLSLEGITIGLDRLVARQGERVKVFIDIAPGISVSRVYMKHTDGEETVITDNAFLMPADDVSICVDFVIEEYTVIFVSDGKTIASFVCRYGDEITPPAPPSKASDGKYKYTFVGWDAEISPVTQSTVYTAIYKQELLPQNELSGLQIAPSVLRILLLGASFVAVFLFGMVPSVTLFAVFSVKRKRMRIKTK